MKTTTKTGWIIYLKSRKRRSNHLFPDGGWHPLNEANPISYQKAMGAARTWLKGWHDLKLKIVKVCREERVLEEREL